MKAAQKELLTLAELADYKSRNTTTTAGEVDLDKMFLFLKEDTKPKTAADSKFFSSLTSEMDQLFSTVAIEEAKVKPTRKAPPVPIDPAGKLSRTQRRETYSDNFLLNQSCCISQVTGLKVNYFYKFLGFGQVMSLNKRLS